MNYRHQFHAGNFADVHKHVVMVALTERLLGKPKPLFYLDTHAGRGVYDLRSSEAERGGEWRSGVGRVASAAVMADDLRRYIAALVDAVGKPGARYPGSPLLAARQLRAIDRLVCVEQQVTESRHLETLLRGRRGVSVICGDGYAALKTYLPPRENRGLVLIDPPYEAANEFARAAEALQFGLSRWPNGVFALWYPVKAGGETARLRTTLRRSGLRKLLVLELAVRPVSSPLGLNGSGMLIANPPWRFDEEMRIATDELHRLLDPEAAGGVSVEWLVGE